MFKNPRSKKGFTLLELIVVVVVLGILAALAIPSFSTVKQSAADKVAYNSASSVVRNAQAQAAFEGASLSDTYVDAAGTEITGYNANTNTVTITSGGKTGAASINATTGEVTIAGASTGGGSFTPTYTFNQDPDFLSGSCNVSGNEFAGGTNTVSLYCASGALKTALATLTSGSTIRLTYPDAVETFIVDSVSLASPTQITMTTAMRSEYGGTFTKIEF